MIPEIEKLIESILGSKIDGKYILADKITVKVEEKSGGTYLWVEDRRGNNAYGWIINIERSENGYKFYSDHDYEVECNTLEKVFDTVKRRNY